MNRNCIQSPLRNDAQIPARAVEQTQSCRELLFKYYRNRDKFSSASPGLISESDNSRDKSEGKSAGKSSDDIPNDKDNNDDDGIPIFPEMKVETQSGGSGRRISVGNHCKNSR